MGSEELPNDLPSLPTDWEWRSLGSYVNSSRGICYGIVQPGKEDPDGVPIIRVKDFEDGRVSTSGAKRVAPSIEENYARSRLQGGEVLLSLVGTLGLVAIADDDLAGSNIARAVGLIPVERKIARFVALSLRSEFAQRYMQRWATTTVQATLNLRDVKRLPIPHPPLPEQRRIAAVLGALDDKIELNRKMNRTLEEMAQAIFKSWFIDFDGVPPEDLVDSELGPIPRGWEVSEIGDRVRVMGGGTPSTKKTEYWESGSHRWTTPKDLSTANSPVLLDTLRKITDVGLAKISSGLLPKGTFLLSSRAPVGYTAIAMIPVAVNQGYIAIPPGDDLSPLYMYHWCVANLDVIKSHAGGTTFQEISKRNFRPLKITVPPAREMHKFDEVVSLLFGRITESEREIRTLAQLRDTLLPKLISGEIQVPEAELQVETAR